jgi:hypothetical protein
VPVPCFLLFLCFKKVTQEIFSELDETKASRPDISRSFQNTEEETQPDQRVATPPGEAAQPWPVPAYGVGPLVHFRRRLFAYKDPPTGNPKDPITFPEHIAICRRRRPKDREGPKALPGTLPERGITTEGLLHRHACLQRDE